MLHQISQIFIHTLKHASSITVFVASMMIIIDVVNVLTKGDWQKKISKTRFIQYISSSFLGSTPGCLGAFTVVSMYTHKIVGLGAVTATMVATSGDEAFVMFAMFPKTALLMVLAMFFIGMLSGWLTDLLLPLLKISTSQNMGKCKKGFEVHPSKQEQPIFCKRSVINTLTHPSKIRFALFTATLITISAFFLGFFGKSWNWVRITFIVILSLDLTILLFVSNHFIKDHLWEHVIKKHIPSIFLWTWGTLALLAAVNALHLTSYVTGSGFLLLITAIIVGILPQSGPHLIFVTMFAQGLAPFSVLLASSISQDGHGSIPLLAHSRRDFLIVKVINMAVALLFGGTLYLIGY